MIKWNHATLTILRQRQPITIRIPETTIKMIVIIKNQKVSDLGSPVNINNSQMQDGKYLLVLTLVIKNYFANKQNHVMKTTK